MSYSIEIIKNCEVDEFTDVDGFTFGDSIFSVNKGPEWWHFPMEGIAMIHIKKEESKGDSNLKVIQ